MKVCIGVAAGVGKPECQDAAFFNQWAAEPGIWEWEAEKLTCLGAADGVGGNPGGKQASGFAAEKILKTDFSAMTEAQLREYVGEWNQELLRYAAELPGMERMATTLSCIVAAADGYYCIHAGNTRIYGQQGAYLKQFTKDQTKYNWLMEQGEYEAAAQCGRNVINGCFGGGDPRYASRAVVQKIFAQGLPETLVLTSDGVHEYVDTDAMEAVLASGKSQREMVQNLLDTALENGSTDDRTVIIARRA